MKSDLQTAAVEMREGDSEVGGDTADADVKKYLNVEQRQEELGSRSTRLISFLHCTCEHEV